MKRLAIAAMVLVFAAAALGAGCAKKKQEAAVSIADMRKDTGMPVKVVVAANKLLADRIKVSGTVEAPDEIHLTPEVGGQVVAVYVDKGDRIGKGQPLLQIKKDDYDLGVRQARAAFEMATQQLEMAKTGARPEELEQAKNMADQAEAGYNMARKDYDRVKELYEKGVASRQQLDGVEAQLISVQKQFDSAKEGLQMAKSGARSEQIKLLEAQAQQAKAAKESAELMLERTTVRSTVDGVVSYRFCKVGESVGPNNPIFQILKAGDKKIAFTINESDLSRVSEGDRVVFEATGIQNGEFEAEVTYVSRFVRKMTREAELEAKVTKEPVPLSHGMFVEGYVVLPDTEMFVIPHKALMENKYVTIVEGDEGFIRECNKIVRVGQYVQIRDDCVKPGELVVVEGQGIMEDKMKVKVKETLEY